MHSNEKPKRSSRTVQSALYDWFLPTQYLNIKSESILNSTRKRLRANRRQFSKPDSQIHRPPKFTSLYGHTHPRIMRVLRSLNESQNGHGFHSNYPNEDTKDKAIEGRPRCKYCDGTDLIKWGEQSGHQRYRCKECKHVFDNNGKLPRMRNETDIIAVALDLYFEGLSLRKVQRHLRRKYRTKVGFREILGWIEKYVPPVEEFTDTLEPKLSDTWHADENAMKFQWETPRETGYERRPGIQWWFWDCIDKGTRYLVGCHLSKERGEGEAKKFMGNCAKTGRRPKKIITDGLPSYHKGINKVFFSRYKDRRVKHIKAPAIPKTRIRIHNQLIERLHGTFDDRVDAMRGLKSHETKVLRGLRLHYNFLRPHEALDYITPAEAADVYLPFNDGWGDLIRWAICLKNQPEDDGDYTEVEIISEN